VASVSTVDSNRRFSCATWILESSSRPNDERSVRYVMISSGTINAIAVNFTSRNASTSSSDTDAPAT
jgi:hypothetical protein